MPENTEAAPPAPADVTRNTFAIAAGTMGRDLTAALLNELRNLPDHWSRMNQDLQQKTLERFKDRIAETVKTALNMLTASNFQAVPAVLEFVSRKEGIKAGLSVNADALCRHALFDAAGKAVLVVIADPSTWLQRMDEIKVTGNQADLFANSNANYDPAIDAPGYRRDHDTFAPGPKWDDLKANLGLPPAGEGETPPSSDDNAGSGETPPAVPPGDDPAVDSDRVSLEFLRERLAGLGIDVTLGALQSRASEDILAASLWLEFVDDNGMNADARASRPAWLPEPPPKKGKGK